MKQHTPTRHARLSASSSHRWMNCAGAPRMEAGLPDTDSEYSIEGTAAHELAAHALLGGIVGEVAGPIFVQRKDGTTAEVEITLEMRDAAMLYASEVHRVVAAAGPGAVLYVERVVSLEKLDPPEPMYGTPDAIVSAPGLIHNFDFKYGTGVVVEVQGNSQLMQYLLGARLSLDEHPGLDVTYRATIVQPRAHHEDGPVRTAEYTWAELRDFGHRLIAGAERAHAPDAPLTPGRWCRWCKAAAFCPALAAEAGRAAQDDFATPNTVFTVDSDLGDLQFRPGTTISVPPARFPTPLPDPALLPLDTVLRALDKADLVRGFFAAVESRVERELLAGNDVPGWKLVEGRPMRVWAVQTEDLEQVFGEELYERSPRSVTQMEKIVGKKNVPPEFIARVSKSVKLARSDDMRPALIQSPQSEFLALPPASEPQPPEAREPGAIVE